MVNVPMHSFSCIVLTIEFPEEKVRWAARIPYDQEFSFLRFCVRPLEYVARNFPNVPAARVHGYFDAGAVGENPVGVAYMLVDWTEGKHMEPWSLTEPAFAMKKKVLDQLADMMLEMLLKPAGDDILFYGAYIP